MTTLGDVLKAVREVIVINERVTTLTSRVDRMDESHADLRDRVVRMEVFFDFIKPMVQKRALSAPDSE
jgi:hypothetical protein